LDDLDEGRAVAVELGGGDADNDVEAPVTSGSDPSSWDPIDIGPP